MSLFNQPLLDLHDELIIDLFAGGGGASAGIEQATGRMVDIAINHDSAAVSMHQVNHPQTRHLVSDVFEVCPKTVTEGRKVGFLWASPDCTYHSKARGGKPIRSKTKKRRALAWVVTRWAGQVKPRVIMLENVEEFANWGPLVGPPDNLRPCKKRRGQSFKKWVKSLTDLGYVVEWRELRACDYGAPTIRKRLYLIARCDGEAIVWPESTHGAKPGLKPFRTAAECIDWDIPMLSIFATREEAKEWGRAHHKPAPIRPLAEKTQRRIARGVKRFVLNNPKPFLVTVAHGEGSESTKRWGQSERGLDKPLVTITQKGNQAVVAPYLTPRYGERAGQEPRSRSVEEPAPVVVPSGNGGNLVAAHLTTFRSGSTGHELDEPAKTVTANSHDPNSKPGGAAPMGLVAANLVSYHNDGDQENRSSSLDQPIHTIDTNNRHGIVASFLGQYNGGFAEGNSGDGHKVDDPLSTIATKGPYQSVVTAFLDQANGGFDNRVGRSVEEPAGAVCATGSKAPLVASFLSKFYGTTTGQECEVPLHTVTGNGQNFGLVTVTIGGQTFVVDDIAMRMLQPSELYLAQGFRRSYIIDRGHDGRTITKTEQVRMCGNSVSPPVAEALVRANCPELIVRQPKGSELARAQERVA